MPGGEEGEGWGFYRVAIKWFLTGVEQSSPTESNGRGWGYRKLTATEENHLSTTEP